LFSASAAATKNNAMHKTCDGQMERINNADRENATARSRPVPEAFAGFRPFALTFMLTGVGDVF
jgi:hypothetical protein